jgi:S-adenosylmethionine:tRNA ribosyltransferase-isomerase
VKARSPRLRAAAVPAEPREAVRLVILERATGAIDVATPAALAERLVAGDLLVVNDAATWPASLPGTTARGEPVELRWTTGAFGPGDAVEVVLLGAGDWRTPTEHRPPPPAVRPGEAITVAGGLALPVVAIRPPRRATVAVPGSDGAFCALHAAGRPVQYAHLARPLALWDVQTVYAGRPWAVEMPSAGRSLTWDLLLRLRARGVRVAALTHAAGLSSTGDPALDATLPWPECYEVPAATAAAVGATRAAGGRVIAVGTTVVRALESAAGPGGAVAAGPGVATRVLGAGDRLAVVGGVLSGLHDPTDSHARLLEAFAPPRRLRAAWRRARALDLASHELGDALLVI